METIRCPHGHAGPWRYVEAVEVWRHVLVISSDYAVVDGRWQTGEGYDEGVAGSEYLECWFDLGGQKCVERVPVPAGLNIVWQ